MKKKQLLVFIMAGSLAVTNFIHTICNAASAINCKAGKCFYFSITDLRELLSVCIRQSPVLSRSDSYDLYQMPPE